MQKDTPPLTKNRYTLIRKYRIDMMLIALVLLLSYMASRIVDSDQECVVAARSARFGATLFWIES